MTGTGGVLLDSNVLIDIANSNTWAGWSAEQVGDAIDRRAAHVNQLVYAETVLAFGPGRFDQLFPPTLLRRANLPWEAAAPAGRAFVRYRKAGGAKTSPLPDFYIGAHALVAGFTVLTRDPDPFRYYFPDVPLITPDGG